DLTSAANRQMIQFFRQHGTVIDPTIALYELYGRPADVPATTFEPGVAKVAPELREQLINMGVAPNRAPLSHKRRQIYLETVGALHRAGVPIVAGTDQAVPGYSVYRELELYVEAGFTPLQALQAA